MFQRRMVMKTFEVGYMLNGIAQGILVDAENEEDALEVFKEHKPKAMACGATEFTGNPRKGKPVLRRRIV